MYSKFFYANLADLSNGLIAPHFCLGFLPDWKHCVLIEEYRHLNSMVELKMEEPEEFQMFDENSSFSWTKELIPLNIRKMILFITIIEKSIKPI